MSLTPIQFAIACVRAVPSQVRVLQQHFEACKQNPTEVFLWFDIFCINLHRAGRGCDTTVGDHELDAMRGAIASVGKVIFVLDRSGAAFGRTWVMWELWQASTSKASSERLVVLPVGWGWTRLTAPYGTLSTAISATSM